MKNTGCDSNSFVQITTGVQKIQQIYDDNNQIFGAAKIAAVMKNEGYHISGEMVRELMRDIGLLSIQKD